jgi:dTDP-glucose 4,6-dehydratase
MLRKSRSYGPKPFPRPTSQDYSLSIHSVLDYTSVFEFRGNMKILVTGGAGFIGSNFIKTYLLQPNFQESKIYLLDSLTYASNEDSLDRILVDSRVEFIHGDICDSDLVDEITKQVEIVVNFAAESHVDRSILDPSIFVRTNILGTHNLLYHSKKNGIKKFLQVSTDEVYGSIENGSWNEDFPLKPNSPYSASKASGDLIARSYHETFKFPVIVTRCSNNFGPNQNIEKFIPNSITNIIRGKPITLYGDGKNKRDWIHVDDHNMALCLLLTKGEGGEVYNIGSGNEYSNLNLAKLICDLMQQPHSIIEYVQNRLGHDFRYSVDFSKIKSVGFQPRNNFIELLQQTIEWYKSNINWWD